MDDFRLKVIGQLLATKVCSFEVGVLSYGGQTSVKVSVPTLIFILGQIKHIYHNQYF